MNKSHNSNYALEWFKYALEHNDDPIIKFMMLWVSFNWLYQEYKEYYEWQRVGAFCDSNKECLQNFDAFSTEAINIFLTSPVVDARFGRCHSYNQEYFNKLKRYHCINSLFQTMYQVRCNLFHGSKCLRNPRDRELVDSSAIILEGYLREYFKANPDNNDKSSISI